MTHFFFDNNLPPKAARALNVLKECVTHLADVPELRRDAPDEAWIELCAERDWVAVSHDRAILSKQHLKEALEKSGLTIIWFHRSLNRMSPEDLVILFLKAWGNIEAAVGRARPGSNWFALNSNGKVTPYGR